MRSTEQDLMPSNSNGTRPTASNDFWSPDDQTQHPLGLKAIVSVFGLSSVPWIATLTALSSVLFIATCALILTGCASSTQPSEARAPIPANLTQPCESLPTLADGTGASVLRWITQAAQLYQECSARQRHLSEAVQGDQ